MYGIEIRKETTMKNEIKKFRPSRFWSNVNALKEHYAVSNSDLSEIIGRPKTYIANALHNMGSPNVADALAISQYFGVTVEEMSFEPVGLHIRQKQLEEELAKIKAEIAESEGEDDRAN